MDYRTRPYEPRANFPPPPEPLRGVLARRGLLEWWMTVGPDVAAAHGGEMRLAMIEAQTAMQGGRT